MDAQSQDGVGDERASSKIESQAEKSHTTNSQALSGSGGSSSLVGMLATLSTTVVTLSANVVGQVSSRVQTTWSEMITQQSDEHDPSLCGIALQDCQEFPPVCAAGWRDSALDVAKRYPGHCVFELRYYSVPAILALVPAVVKSFTIRAQLRLVEDYEGNMYSVSMWDGMPLTGRWLDLAAGVPAIVGLWLSVASWLYSLWSTRVVRTYIVKWCPIGLLCSVIGYGVIYVPMYHYWYPMHYDYLYITEWVYQFSVVVAFGTVLTRAGRACSNPTFKLVCMPWLAIMLVGMGILESYVYMMVGPDYVKALFVGFLNPLLFELCCITPARFVARSLRHNHESTSFVIIVPFIFLKQWCGRSVAAMINDSTWLYVLCATNSLCEFTLRVTLARRDATLYNCIFSRWLPRGANALDLAQLPRNRWLRAANSMAESIGEFIAIWNGVALVILLDVSPDGKSPVNLWKLLQNGLLQTASELLTDCVSVLVLGRDGSRVLGLAASRYWYWSAAFASSIMFAYAYCLESIYIIALCHEPGLPATWAPCGKLKGS